MTQEQQDAAWRSLPEDFKRQLRCDYTTAESVQSLDPTNVRIEAHKYFIDMYFGKHNLTATAEEKPRFSKGDKVLYIGEKQEFRNSIWRIDGEVFYNDYYKCDMVSSLFDGDTHVCNVPLSDLAPYAEKQEPSIEAEEIRKAEEELQERKAEHLDRMLYPEKYCTHETTLDKVKTDWLAYRMELAKAITPILVANCNDDATPTDTIYVVMQIVNGIVERLKGGEK